MQHSDDSVALNLRLVDALGERRPQLPINSAAPVPFANENFEGVVLVGVKSDKAGPLAARRFEGLSRRFWVQVQGRFKPRPEGSGGAANAHPVVVGGEVPEPMELGFMTRGLCGVMLKVTRSVLPGLDSSFGGKTDADLPHIVFPLFQAAKAMVVTPPGETPPLLGEGELPEEPRSRKARTGTKFAGVGHRYDPDATYSFEFYSPALDLSAWRVNMPATDAKLSSFWRSMPLYVVCYENCNSGGGGGSGGKGASHSRRYFFRFELQSYSNMGAAERNAAISRAAAMAAEAAATAPGANARARRSSIVASEEAAKAAMQAAEEEEEQDEARQSGISASAAGDEGEEEEEKEEDDDDEEEEDDDDDEEEGTHASSDAHRHIDSPAASIAAPSAPWWVCCSRAVDLGDAPIQHGGLHTALQRSLGRSDAQHSARVLDCCTAARAGGAVQPRVCVVAWIDAAAMLAAGWPPARGKARRLASVGFIVRLRGATAAASTTSLVSHEVLQGRLGIARLRPTSANYAALGAQRLRLQRLLDEDLARACSTPADAASAAAAASLKQLLGTPTSDSGATGASGAVAMQGYVVRALWERAWREEWAELQSATAHAAAGAAGDGDIGEGARLVFHRVARSGGDSARSGSGALASPTACIAIAAVTLIEAVGRDGGGEAAEEEEGPFCCLPCIAVHTAWRVYYVLCATEQARGSWLAALRRALEEEQQRRGDGAGAVHLGNPQLEMGGWRGRWRCAAPHSIVLNGRDLHREWERGSAVACSRASTTERAGPLVRRLLRQALQLRPDSDAGAHADLASGTALLKALCSADLVGEQLEEEEEEEKEGKEEEAAAGEEAAAMCFYLNMYHLLLQHAFLLLGAPGSGLVGWHRFHQRTCYEVGDRLWSLAELEHRALRARLSPPASAIARWLLPSKDGVTGGSAVAAGQLDGSAACGAGEAFVGSDSDSGRGHAHVLFPATSARDSRLCLALNCGSMACLPWVPVYEPVSLWAQLRAATAALLDVSVSISAVGNPVRSIGGGLVIGSRGSNAVVTLPKQIEWFHGDFAPSALWLDGALQDAAGSTDRGGSFDGGAARAGSSSVALLDSVLLLLSRERRAVVSAAVQLQGGCRVRYAQYDFSCRTHLSAAPEAAVSVVKASWAEASGGEEGGGGGGEKQEARLELSTRARAPSLYDNLSVAQAQLTLRNGVLAVRSSALWAPRRHRWKPRHIALSAEGIVCFAPTGGGVLRRLLFRPATTSAPQGMRWLRASRGELSEADDSKLAALMEDIVHGVAADAATGRAVGFAGVEIRDRKHRLRSYKQCFIGKALVSWLLEHGYAADRAAALALGRQLPLQHVVDEHEFKDEDLFYRVVGGTGRAVASEGEEGDLVTVQALAGTAHTGVFHVTAAGSELVLAAETVDEMDQWISDIRQAAAGSLAQHEGAGTT
jgi:hypothetical protein